MLKATLFCLLLIFGLAACDGLFEFVDSAYNNGGGLFDVLEASEEGDAISDAIVISDPSKFPDPNDEVTKRPVIVLPDPETERPIGSHDKPSDGGFMIDIPKVSTPTPMPVFNSWEPTTQKYNGADGAVSIDNWDFSKKPTEKPKENKGILGNILGGWKTALDGQKKAIEDTYNSGVDAGGKWINATRNTADQLIEVEKKTLDKFKVDTKLLNATREVVDTVFDKKSAAWDKLHTKQKGLLPDQTDDGYYDGKAEESYVWNPPNDVASDIFDPVDWESDNDVPTSWF